MDFSLTTDLIGESRERVQAWIVEYWKAIEEEEPDNEYIDYIMVWKLIYFGLIDS